MSSAVPAPLARVVSDLRCPVCAGPLAAGDGALRCACAHTFDVSRHGVVTLTSPRRRPASGDDAGMVAAREAVLGAGHFEPLTRALVAAVVQAGVPDRPLVLDVGAGTGHHLASVLEALPGACGVAFDASRAALRRAVRLHRRIAAVAGDVWDGVPLTSAAADLVLNAFAPRHAAEFARVLRPGGALLVATPAPDHLRELGALHRVGMDPRKHERLHGRLAPAFAALGTRRVAWPLRVTRPEADSLVRMGPAAHHLSPAYEERVRALPPTVAVTAAVELHVFERRP